MLRERRIGRLEVKQRGTRHDPAAVQRELKVPGDESATLVLFRRGKSIVAILAQRSRSAGGSASSRRSGLQSSMPIVNLRPTRRRPSMPSVDVIDFSQSPPALVSTVLVIVLTGIGLQHGENPLQSA